MIDIIIAPSYLSASEAQSGISAADDGDIQTHKYNGFLQEYISATVLDFISDLGRRLKLVSGEQRETS